MNSTHRVEVVPVRLEPHPNADSLSVVRVFDGYTCCVRTADWKDGDLAAYVPPDSVVDATRPEFAFCAGQERIRVKRLRGVVSMGLLVPAPDGAQVGENVADALGVTHYEPPVQLAKTGGETASPPPGFHPCYDVDSIRRYASVFESGEPVWITEKIHGANGRFCFTEGAMHAGSRTEWKRQDADILWWRALAVTPELEAFCRAHPDWTVYGEVYGQVQDLRYGTQRGEVRFAAFDILVGTRWLNPAEARDVGHRLPWVPIVSESAPFDLEAVLACAEGPSLVPGADHVREGVVVKPTEERTHPLVGRVNLKAVGNGYFERKG